MAENKIRTVAFHVLQLSRQLLSATVVVVVVVAPTRQVNFVSKTNNYFRFRSFFTQTQMRGLDIPFLREISLPVSRNERVKNQLLL